MSELTLAAEPCERILRYEGAELVREHQAECGVHQEIMPLDIDWHLMKSLEAAGLWVTLALRRKGVLIGYSNWAVMRPVVYQTTLYASCQQLFLRASERRGWAGVKLIRGAETIFRALGVRVIDYHTFVASGLPDMSRLFKRLGYAPRAVVLSKGFA
jgi:GNAT superfamily N-acetyltransferase